MQILVILGTWGWKGRQENCNVGPVSRKEVKEMKKKKKQQLKSHDWQEPIKMGCGKGNS